MISDSTPKFLTKLFGKMDGEQKASRGFFFEVVVLEIPSKGGWGYYGLPFFSSLFSILPSNVQNYNFTHVIDRLKNLR